MGSYAAIADVSTSLLEVLKAGLIDQENPEMSLVSDEDVGLWAPDDENGPVPVTLTLYRVAEHSTEKNAAQQAVGTTTFRPPPLSLELHYLLTTYPDSNSSAEDPHLLLGRAMQILHDNRVIDDDGEETYVSLNPLSMEELADIWSTVTEASFHPSVSYVVSPVTIESTREDSTQRVLERRIGEAGDSE